MHLNNFCSNRQINLLKGFLILNCSDSVGINGSTDFAKKRILQEGGKTIEALYWEIVSSSTSASGFISSSESGFISSPN